MTDPFASSEDGESPLTMMLPIVDVFLVLVVVLFAQAKTNPAKLVAPVPQVADAKEKVIPPISVRVFPGGQSLAIGGKAVPVAAFIAAAEGRADTYLLLPDPSLQLPDFLTLIRELSARKITYAVAPQN